ncbi:MAG: hypothetical protein ACO1G1_10310, partial [Bacteroidota bacterium]
LVFALVSHKFRNKMNHLTGIEKSPWLNRFLQISITFLLSCFAWIFFRANHVTDAFLIIKKMATSSGAFYIENPSVMIFSFLGLFILLFVELKQEFYKGDFSFFNNKRWIVRNLSYAILIVIILLFGVFDGGQFIYFQF